MRMRTPVTEVVDPDRMMYNEGGVVITLSEIFAVAPHHTGSTEPMCAGADHLKNAFTIDISSRWDENAICHEYFIPPG